MLKKKQRKSRWKQKKRIDLRKKYMRFRSKNSKRAFNREHRYYGSVKVKGPKLKEKNISKWEKGKRDTYRSG